MGYHKAKSVGLELEKEKEGVSSPRYQQMVYTKEGFSIMKSVYLFENSRKWWLPLHLPLPWYHTHIALGTSIHYLPFHMHNHFSTPISLFSLIYLQPHSLLSPHQLASFMDLAGKNRHSALWILNSKISRVKNARIVKFWTHKLNFGFHLARAPWWDQSRFRNSHSTV